MIKTVLGTYRDGVIYLAEPLDLEPDTRVRIRVEIVERGVAASRQNPDATEAFCGLTNEGSEDEAIAENHNNVSGQAI